MKATKITQNQVKEMFNETTVFLHITGFKTGLRTNLKKAVAKCVYISRESYNTDFQNDKEKLIALSEIHPQYLFNTKKYGMYCELENEYTSYRINFDDNSKYYALSISGMNFIIVSDLGFCNVYQYFTDETVVKQPEPETTDSLVYKTSKTYEENGDLFRIEVAISLDDNCNNGHCTFSTTGDIYRIYDNRPKDYAKSGCIHEDILKHFPEFKIFTELHVRDCHGAPMYSVVNSTWHMKNSNKDIAMRYLRITESEYDELLPIVKTDDILYFQYRLQKLGIIDRWQQEADTAIIQLEKLTGKKWVNPYTLETEKPYYTPLTDEEIQEIERRIALGYYTQEAQAERVEKAKQEAFNRKYQNIMLTCDEEVQKAITKRNVYLAILETEIPMDNVIYYDHSNEIEFNFKTYGDQVTKKQFDEFLNKVDKSKLPEGIKFRMK